MKRCPITYEIISDAETYSQRGLRLLSPQLEQLQPLEFSAAEQRREAIARAGKMSIQGVQTKLSAQLKVKEGHFELVEQYGHYILKPQSTDYPELPENEALTMTLATSINLEVPVHGLVHSKDNTLTYFVKRFDRAGHNKKFPLEDFAQLLNLSRDTKYQSSMEKVAKVINNFCTFPKIEAAKLLKITLFNFLTGNEDMHLKNFSLITRDNIITLSPAYDLLNTSIALGEAEEETALLLNGKKSNFKQRDFLDYYALQQLKLNEKVIHTIIQDIKAALPGWHELIGYSFLSPFMQEKYRQLLDTRCKRLGI